MTDRITNDQKSMISRAVLRALKQFNNGDEVSEFCPVCRHKIVINKVEKIMVIVDCSEHCCRTKFS